MNMVKSNGKVAIADVKDKILHIRLNQNLDGKENIYLKIIKGMVKSMKIASIKYPR